jgi:hypothetical protein
MNIFKKLKEVKNNIASKNIEASKNLSPGLLKNLASSLEKAMFSDSGNNSFDISAKSIMSKTSFTYDIPEIENLEINFVYNYFTKDERSPTSSSKSEKIINIQVETTSDFLYNVRNEQLPRYVKFSFKPPRDPFAKIATANDKTLIDNLEKIAKEGAGSDKFFTGVELKDSGEEKTIYANLKNAGFITQIATPLDSSQAIAKKISNINSDPSGITGLGKKYILESLNQLKDDQLTCAPSDVSPEVANFSDNPVGRQTFSVKFNNLFIDDIVKKGNRLPTSVFQDELYELSKITKEYQSNTLSKIGNDPTKLYEDEFVNHVSAFEIIKSNVEKKSKAVKKAIIEKDYEVTLLGYLIEKTEVLPDESVIVHEPFIVNDPQKLFVKDDKVRYGGNYVYTVRTVCQVITPVLKVDPDNPILDEVVLAKFVMASEGVTNSILCQEKVPPPPPTAIRPRFNYRKKQPVINWQFPVNPQRDIKRFQIFKRQNVNFPFTLVAEYDFDDSISRTSVNEIATDENLLTMQFPKTTYIDENFSIASTPIYAIASVDAHGMTSNLSTQIQIRFDRSKNKMTSKLVSREGAPKQYPNIYLEQDTFKDVMMLSDYQRMHVFFDPEYYRVLKNDNSNSRKNIKLEKDLKLIASDPDNSTYSIQILNIDNQKDAIINIKIKDKSGTPQRVSSKTITGL